MRTTVCWSAFSFLTFLPSALSAKTIALFDGTPNSFLCTEADYADFTLDLAFNIDSLGTSLKTWLDDEARAAIHDNLTPCGFIGLQAHGVGNDAAKFGLKARFKNLVLQLSEGAVDAC